MDSLAAGGVGATDTKGLAGGKDGSAAPSAATPAAPVPPPAVEVATPVPVASVAAPAANATATGAAAAPAPGGGSVVAVPAPSSQPPAAAATGGAGAASSAGAATTAPPASSALPYPLGVVPVTVPNPDGGEPLVTGVAPECMFRRDASVKPAWHHESLRPRREAFIELIIRHTLAAPLIEFRRVYTPDSMPAPPAPADPADIPEKEVMDFEEAYPGLSGSLRNVAMCMERALFYGAPSMDAYLDRRTLPARLAALSPYRQRLDDYYTRTDEFLARNARQVMLQPFRRRHRELVHSQLLAAAASGLPPGPRPPLLPPGVALPSATAALADAAAAPVAATGAPGGTVGAFSTVAPSGGAAAPGAAPGPVLDSAQISMLASALRSTFTTIAGTTTGGQPAVAGAAPVAGGADPRGAGAGSTGVGAHAGGTASAAPQAQGIGSIGDQPDGSFVYRDGFVERPDGSVYDSKGNRLADAEAAALKATKDAIRAHSADITRQQQDRLRLLYHASTCGGGSCPWGAVCESMRVLRRHLESCTGTVPKPGAEPGSNATIPCPVRHCVSSQYCLNHFRSCKNAECKVCKPVRVWIQQEAVYKALLEKATPAVIGQLTRPASAQAPPPPSESGELPGVPLAGTKRPAPYGKGDAAGWSLASPPSGDELAELVVRARLAFSAATPILTAAAAAAASNPSSPPPAEEPSIALTGLRDLLSMTLPVESGTFYLSRMTAQHLNALPPAIRALVALRLVDLVKRLGPAGVVPAPSKSAPGAARSGPGGGQRRRGKLDGDCSLVYTFDRAAILKHLMSLREDFCALATPGRIRERVMPILDYFREQEHGWIFSSAVDPVKLKIPDYYDVIKRPMDLGTIKRKLDSEQYRTYKAVGEDIALVWANAMRYNSADSPIHQIAKRFSDLFEAHWRELEESYNKVFHVATSYASMRETHCSLCGGHEFPFEPPTLYCNKCSTRIKKGSVYYRARANRYHLCYKCASSYKKTDNVEVDPNTSVPFKEFSRCSPAAQAASETDTEPWIQCDYCERWQHQACALYNSKRSANQDVPHYCAHCILGHMTAKKQNSAIAKMVRGAKDLVRTRLSDHIESRINTLVEARRPALAYEYDQEVHRFTVQPLTVRMVACTDKVLFPDDAMATSYPFYPTQFNYRSKALMLWQLLGGVDVFLYGVYVQEYGDDCPSPNRRTAYISYLDSVKYLEPPTLRTDVYHEVLIAYLEDLRARGFNQVSLWSCPPLKGDDYILSCHPEEQRIPRPDRLREWYLTMLESAVRRGIVERVVFLADDYFPSRIGSEGGADRALTELPYCEGDYWPGVVKQCLEELLKEAEGKEAEKEKEKSRGSSSSSSAEGKAAGGAALSASASLTNVGEAGSQGAATAGEGAASQAAADAEAEAARKRKAGARPAAGAARSRNPRRDAAAAAAAAAAGGAAEGGAGGAGSNGSKRAAFGTNLLPLPPDALRDKIAALLTSTHMQKDFIIVKLRPSCQLCKTYITGEPGLERKYHCVACHNTPCPSLIQVKGSNRGGSGSSAGGSSAGGGAAAGANGAGTAPAPGSTPAPPPASGSLSASGGGIMCDLCPSCYEREREDAAAGRAGLLQHAHPISSFVPVDVEIAPGLRSQAASPSTAPGAKPEPKVVVLDSASEAAAAPSSAAAAPSGPVPVQVATVAAAVPPPPPLLPAGVPGVPGAGGSGVMADPDPLVESPFFVTRQAFLNLCQSNHYQFDQLRRAKHSSMMVLWHMHHPFAPAFIHSCNVCNQAIDQQQEWRYTCMICDEYDVCPSCYAKQQRHIARRGAAGGAEGTPAADGAAAAAPSPAASEGSSGSSGSAPAPDTLPPHPHPLLKVPVGGTGDEDPRLIAVAQAQRARQAQLARDLQVLGHAARCYQLQTSQGTPACGNAECLKMCTDFTHGAACAQGPDGGCGQCQDLAVVIKAHAKVCRLQAGQCIVPGCNEEKNLMRRAATAQGAYDARRRTVMTNLALGRPTGQEDPPAGSAGGSAGSGPSGASGEGGAGAAATGTKAEGSATGGAVTAAAVLASPPPAAALLNVPAAGELPPLPSLPSADAVASAPAPMQLDALDGDDGSAASSSAGGGGVGSPDMDGDDPMAGASSAGVAGADFPAFSAAADAGAAAAAGAALPPPAALGLRESPGPCGLPPSLSPPPPLGEAGAGEAPGLPSSVSPSPPGTSFGGAGAAAPAAAAAASTAPAPPTSLSPPPTLITLGGVQYNMVDVQPCPPLASIPAATRELLAKYAPGGALGTQAACEAAWAAHQADRLRELAPQEAALEADLARLAADRTASAAWEGFFATYVGRLHQADKERRRGLLAADPTHAVKAAADPGYIDRLLEAPAQISRSYYHTLRRQALDSFQRRLSTGAAASPPK